MLVITRKHNSKLKKNEIGDGYKFECEGRIIRSAFEPAEKKSYCATNIFSKEIGGRMTVSLGQK